MKKIFLTISLLLLATTFAYSQCQASFTYTVQGTIVSFTNTSTTSGTGTTYSWNFGDGTSTSIQNPTHTYTQAGNYTVCLTISELNLPPNPPCQDTYCDTIVITSSGSNCSALFSSYQSTTNPLTIVFQDSSIGNPTSWTWNFGDGTSSSLQNPTHTYSQAGTYFVCLSIIATGTTTTCQDTFCDSVIVIGSGVNCTASFTSSPDSINPLKINFSGTATGGTSPSWAWSFGDGSSSTQQNPTHTYLQAGTYYVCLAINVITNSTTCQDTCCDTIIVSSIALPCQAGFTYTSSGNTYNFTDTSKNYSGNNWLWNFGDGITSTLQNPTHTYSVNGTYNVCLTIDDSLCLDSICKPISVTTSIEQLKNNKFYISNIFPNPVSNNFNIEIYVYKACIIELSIYNLYGQLIKSTTINKGIGRNIININSNDLNNGIYTIKFETKEYHTHKKFVKVSK